MSLVPTHMRLSKNQVMKARRGMPIQISAGALREATHQVSLHPENHKKVTRAKRMNKGVRLQLGTHEMQASGFLDDLRNIGRKIQQGAQFVKSHVIDSPFYQQNLRPIARNLVQQGIENFVPAPGRDIARKAAEFASQRTGAFGVRPRRGRPVARRVRYGGSFNLAG